jgi:hypothetical protein
MLPVEANAMSNVDNEAEIIEVSGRKESIPALVPLAKQL